VLALSGLAVVVVLGLHCLCGAVASWGGGGGTAASRARSRFVGMVILHVASSYQPTFNGFNAGGVAFVGLELLAPSFPIVT
jgi:hypothetical protein